MRNLELLLSSSIDGLSELEGCLGLSVDYDTGRVYLATRESNVVCLDPNNQEVLYQYGQWFHFIIFKQCTRETCQCPQFISTNTCIPPQT